MALLRTRHKPTTRGTTQLLGYLRDILHEYICHTSTSDHLLTLSHRVELGLQLLPDRADLPGPLAALLLSDITTLQLAIFCIQYYELSPDLFLHTFLLILSPALGNIIRNNMRIILSPTLTDVLSTAHFWPG